MLPRGILSAPEKTAESSFRKSPHGTLWKYLFPYLSDQFRRSHVFCYYGTLYSGNFSKFPDKHGSGFLLFPCRSSQDHNFYDRSVRNFIIITAQKAGASKLLRQEMRGLLFPIILSFTFSFYLIASFISFTYALTFGTHASPYAPQSFTIADPTIAPSD